MLSGLCSGCGTRLGWKKYKFRGIWRIPGIYCKDCMLKIGKSFEESQGGILTLPKFNCSICKNQLFFPVSQKSGNIQQWYCQYCFQMTNCGKQMQIADRPTNPIPKSNVIAGATGLGLMAAGLIFSFFTLGEEGANMLSFFFGTGTSVAGFIIFRKVLLSRRLLNPE